MLRDAVAQAWPPFVLVAGLLMVGVVAHCDGLFTRAGRLLDDLPGGTTTLFAASTALVAVTTALLNLDTAVVFLTPVLVIAARHRGVNEVPFLYAAVFMANASSLYLPGSNLTNLIVLAEDPIPGGEFARSLFLPAIGASLATAVGLWAMSRRRLKGVQERGQTPILHAGEGVQERGQTPILHGVGAVAVGATVAAAVLVVALREPALPVLVVGLVAVAIEVAQRKLTIRHAVDVVAPHVLLALFAVTVLLGTLARSWDAPADLIADAGRWQAAGIGALAAIAVNNLPAAVMLSAEPIAHPRALLFGLNIGPNLFVTGSLSAFLWWRAARQVGAEPSIAGFARRGLVLAPLALLSALALAELASTRA